MVYTAVGEMTAVTWLAIAVALLVLGLMVREMGR